MAINCSIITRILSIRPFLTFLLYPILGYCERSSAEGVMTIKYRTLFRRNGTTGYWRSIWLSYYYRLRCDSMQPGRNIGLTTFWINLLPLPSVCYAEDGHRISHKNCHIFYKTIWRHVLQHNSLHITAVGSSKPKHTRLNLKYFDILNFNVFIHVSDIYFKLYIQFWHVQIKLINKTIKISFYGYLI